MAVSEHLKRFLRDWIFAPRVTQALNSIRVGELAPDQATVEWPQGAASSLERLRTAPPGALLWVPTSAVRYAHTASAFSYEQSHFVRYLRDGPEVLERFYRMHQPNDQVAQYFLATDGIGTYTPIRFPRLRVPWDYEHLYGGEGRLGPNHGIQGYGPVSTKKLQLEATRLEKLCRSVRRNGFYTGGVRYQLMTRDGSDYRIVITGGQHRVAVLAHLGWPLIPVTAEPRVPREIRLEDLPQWPGVLDGTFSAQAAAAVFRAFFRDPHEVLLPGW